jgi:hypothetical protein
MTNVRKNAQLLKLRSELRSTRSQLAKDIRMVKNLLKSASFSAQSAFLKVIKELRSERAQLANRIRGINQKLSAQTYPETTRQVKVNK